MGVFAGDFFVAGAYNLPSIDCPSPTLLPDRSNLVAMTEAHQELPLICKGYSRRFTCSTDRCRTTVGKPHDHCLRWILKAGDNQVELCPSIHE